MVYSAMTPEATELYQEACSLEYQHDYNAAADKLKEAIKISPEDSMLLTKLAGIYTELNDYDNAVDMYTKAIEIKPNDAFIYISLGSIYETQSKYKEALSAYENALRIFPEYKYNYLNLANVQYQMKDYKSAIENYRLFLDTYAQHWEARKSLANAYLSAGNPEKAVEEFQNLYINNNEHFDDYANFGIALFKTQNYEKAQEILEKAVEKDDTNTTAKICLAMTYQNLEKNDLALAQFNSILKNEEGLNSIRYDYANLLADMGKNKEAIEQYQKYIVSYPKDGNAYRNLGIVYKRENDLVNATENFKKALAESKNDINTKKELAECYHLQKDYINALKYYDEILKQDPEDIETKTNKAFALHATDDYQKAIDLYNEILEQKDSEVVQNNLTDAIISQAAKDYDSKNYKNAIDGYVKAISRGTKDSNAYFGLAKAYRATGVNDKATEYFEKAISMNPENTEYSKTFAEFISEINKPQETESSTEKELSNVVIAVPQSEVKISEPANDNSYINNIEKNRELILAGDKKYKEKKYDEAISNYKDALMLKPSDEETLLKIGNLYKTKKDDAKAIDFYKKAIFVKPEYADGWFNLGLVYADQKNVVQSKKCFEKTIEINPKYAYAYYALARANESEKDTASAIKNYENFLQYSTDENVNKDVQSRIKSLKK